MIQPTCTCTSPLRHRPDLHQQELESYMRLGCTLDTPRLYQCCTQCWATIHILAKQTVIFMVPFYQVTIVHYMLIFMEITQFLSMNASTNILVFLTIVCCPTQTGGVGEHGASFPLSSHLCSVSSCLSI